MIKNIAFVLAILFLISCNSNTESGNNSTEKNAQKVHTPVQLNERVMALENSLEEPMLKAEAEIKVRSDNGNYDGVIQSAKAMEDTIQLRIDHVKSLDPVGVGGDDFKLISTRYFEYLKSIYTTYREMAEAKTDEARLEKAKQMEAIMKGQADVLGNLQRTQQKYAADNGFVY